MEAIDDFNAARAVAAMVHGIVQIMTRTHVTDASGMKLRAMTLVTNEQRTLAPKFVRGRVVSQAVV